MQTNPLQRCCLIRDIDLDNEEEYKAFKWYWEVGLRKVGGVTGWDERIRHFTTISRAPFPQDPSLKLFDISTEAFFVLLWDNCLDKWTSSLAWMKKNPGKKIPTRKTTNKHMDIFKTKYTTQDGGQRKMGGWSGKGIARYNELYDLIGTEKFEGYGTPDQSATPKQAWTDFEEAFLVLLRTDLKIEAPDA